MGDRSASNSKTRIGTRQAIVLSLGLSAGTLFMVVTREIGVVGGYDAYLATPLGYLLGLVIVLPAFIFFGRFPGQRVGILSKSLLGPFLGKVWSLLIAVTAALMAAVLIRNEARFITTAMMQETPIWFIIFMGMLLVLYALYSGIEVLARSTQILFYLVAASIVFMVPATLKYVDISNLLPLLSRGILPYLKSFVPILGFAGEYAVFAAVLAPDIVDSTRNSKRVGIWGWMLAGLLISLTTFSVQGIFGPHEMIKFTNPPFELAKVIQFGGLSQGLEALLVTGWMIAAFLEVSVYYYIATATLTDAFGEPFEKAWILLLALPVFVIAFVLRSQAEIFSFRRLIRYYALLPLGVGSYLLLGLAAVLKGRLKGRDSKSKEGDDVA